MTVLLEEAIAKASELGSKLSDQDQDRLAESILEALEDLEDAEEIKRLKKSGEEAVSWIQAKDELRNQGIDV